MLNFLKLKGLPQSGRHAAMAPNMADALALVQEGRLQEASELLMGNSNSNSSNGSAGRTAATPVSSQPGERVSGWAARGLSGGLGPLSPLDGHPGNPSAVPKRATEARTTSADRAVPRTQAAASSASEPGRFERVAFIHHGASHPYLLYTPSTAAPAGGRPLIMMLHGCTQDAQDFARGTRMNASAEAAGALVLYPTQSHSANANGCWNWFRPEDQRAGAGEPALLLAMVQHAMDAQAVDARRVYVAGLSAGGAMAAVLAQQYPGVFAAVGVHSGLPAGAASNMMGALSAMKSGAKGSRAPRATGGVRVVPLIVLHGDADRTVHHRNAAHLLQGAADGLATTVQTTNEGVSSDGQRYTRTCAVDPSASGEVVAEHWVLHGAGHAWSGGDARGSHTSARGVNASAEMLRFFLEHPREGA